jgi:starch-binding outer membrane protein, SusD/RagB family
MNKYIKNFKLKGSLFGTLALLFISCEDFLDKNPLDQISSPTFWKTQADADMALAGVYSRLNVSTYIFETQAMLSVMAGDANEAGQSLGASSIGTLAAGTIEPTSGGIINSIYQHSYQGISSCNYFLENIDKCDITDEVKNKYKGEVLFLRAFFYFTLTEFYGGVPLYTSTVTIDEAKVKQSTKAEVVAQVLDDLDIAIASLPNTDYSTTGHAVKGSALALKARVLLHQEDWEAAASTANQVITDGNFSLYEDFKNLFLVYGQTDNPEIIFSTRFLNPDNFNQQDIRLEWHAILNPRQELADAFECVDGLPITESPLYDPDNWKLNRDPRMLLTLKLFSDPAVKASGEVVEYAYNGISLTGYEPAKFVDVEVLPIDYATKSEHDWILLRYAEVLLNYAEAKNEFSGPDPSVYAAINEVRARPGINMPPLPEGLTKDQMRERIRQERRVELAMEGIRYGDIKRWKTAETYIPSLVEPGSNLHRQFDPSKNYVFPFPQSEIDINDQLEQNPNY